MACLTAHHYQAGAILHAGFPYQTCASLQVAFLYWPGLVLRLVAISCSPSGNAQSGGHVNSGVVGLLTCSCYARRDDLLDHIDILLSAHCLCAALCLGSLQHTGCGCMWSSANCVEVSSQGAEAGEVNTC
jgi:hypothetical protein